jgi:hypothetical protein
MFNIYKHAPTFHLLMTRPGTQGKGKIVPVLN